MINISLYTNDLSGPQGGLPGGKGGFVAHAEIPPFIVLPEVIVWGERVFKLHNEKAREYVETFCYVVPNVGIQLNVADLSDHRGPT